MLTALEIENFKAFSQRTRIELAPITLLFGENSAGKTSVLQALHAFKQTDFGDNAADCFLPRIENGIVNLGSFSELVSNHETDRTLKFAFEFTQPLQMSARNSVHLPYRLNLPNGNCVLEVELASTTPSTNPEILSVELGARQDGQYERVMRFEAAQLPGQLVLSSSMVPLAEFFFDQHPMMDDAPPVIWAKCVEVSSNPKIWQEWYHAWIKKRTLIVDAIRVYRNSSQGSRTSLDRGMSEGAFEEALENCDVAEAFYNREFTLDEFIQRAAPAQVNSYVVFNGSVPKFAYYPPCDRYPEFEAVRNSVTRTIGRGSVLEQREIEPFGLAHWLEPPFRDLRDYLKDLFPLGPYRRLASRVYSLSGSKPRNVGASGEHWPELLLQDPELVCRTNEWLERLQIGYRIDAERISSRSGDLFEIRLVDGRRRQSIDVSINDVGFGINQLIPLIVQCNAYGSSTVTVEQPEVHIHPRLQADLGDLFAESIKEYGVDQFIIETHSEHLVLRLQRLIREGVLKPDDVSIVYISRGAEGSQARRLRLDEEGDFIDDWPGGFFPERLRELR